MRSTVLLALSLALAPAALAAGNSASRPESTPAPTPAPAPAPAETPPPAADEDEGVPTDDSTFTGPLQPLDRAPRSPEMLYQVPENLTPAQYDARPLPWQAYAGAEMLHLDPEFVHGVQQGLELVYLRKYEGARDHFGALDQRFTNTAIRAIADVVVWQALMLENFDFRYDKQYWTASRQARKDLEAAFEIEGNTAWENLMWAAVVGIESIHTMRQGGYLNALQLAFQAMDAIEKTRAAAPDFVDLKLADGLYNYWRSVVTMNSKILPDFGDHRVEGIEQMQIVETTGVFVAPLSTLSLAFTWLEENDMKKAAASVGKNRAAYPDNITNNLVAAMVYNQMHKYPESLEVLDHIVAVDPDNDRVHYWRGVTLQKQGQLDPAKAEYERYLQSEHLEDYQKSYAHYRLGQVLSRQHQYAEAIRSYEAAIKVDGNKPAKAAKERLEQRKKDGKITW